MDKMMKRLIGKEKQKPTEEEQEKKSRKPKFLVSIFRPLDFAGQASRWRTKEAAMGAIGKGKSSVIRKLGSPVSDPNSTDSYVVEVENDTTDCWELKKQLREFKTALKMNDQKVARLDSLLNRYVARVDELEARVKEFERFGEDGRIVSIRAFCDRVIQDTADHGEEEGKATMKVFGNYNLPKAFPGETLRKLTHGSSACSSKHLHVSSPLNVALALVGVKSITHYGQPVAIQEFKMLYEEIFGLSPEKVAENWRENNLDAQFFTEFVVRKKHG